MLQRFNAVASFAFSIAALLEATTTISLEFSKEVTISYQKCIQIAVTC